MSNNIKSFSSMTDSEIDAFINSMDDTDLLGMQALIESHRRLRKTKKQKEEWTNIISSIQKYVKNYGALTCVVTDIYEAEDCIVSVKNTIDVEHCKQPGILSFASCDEWGTKIIGRSLQRRILSDKYGSDVASSIMDSKEDD